MRILRFDPEVSRPLAEHGSSARISGLAHVRAGALHVLHVPPGGKVGRHPAAVEQFLCVLAGAGRLTGGDGRQRNLPSGYGAVLEPGEEHEFSSEVGATVLCLEGDFSTVAFAVTREIVVVDYDTSWPGAFEEIVAYVWPAVREVAVRIDHVGSTAVPGLAAKPVIDADVVVKDATVVEPVIERLSQVGYRWRGELGVAGREAFAAPEDPALPHHHLYLVVDGSRPHLDHVLLRDLLRGDPDARRRYGELKRANAVAAEGEIDAYVSAKAALVAKLLTRARAERGLEPVEYWTG